jgi:uncharacterized membrane protein YfcA
MNEIWKIVLLGLTGLAAGFINVNAGGGSILTLPALIFLGLDSTIANGTNRVGILAQNIFAVSSFRNQSVHNAKESLLYSAVTLPGAILGSILSLRIDDVWFQRILAFVMLGIVITMIIPQRNINYNRIESSPENRKPALFVLFFIGLYGGFIQVGVGFLLMAALYHILKLNLIYVNMHKVFIVMIYTIPALLIFAISGNVNWLYGLILGLGNGVGAYIGVKVQIRSGEKIIKVILASAILIMAIKLFV